MGGQRGTRDDGRRRHAVIHPALLAPALLALVWGCGGGGNPVAPLVPADGHSHHAVITQTRALTGVRGVVLDVTVIWDLRIEQGASESLWLRVDEALVPYLETPVQGGVLTLRYPFDVRQASRPPLPIEAVLTVIDLDTIELWNAGQIDASGLVVDRLAVRSRGAGEIRIAGLSAGELEVEVQASGPVVAAGEADRQRVRLTGYGAYQAAALASRQATVDVRHSGSATVRVGERLEADLSGAGSVFYYGDPVVESSISGSGTVVRLGG